MAEAARGAFAPDREVWTVLFVGYPNFVVILTFLPMMDALCGP